MIPCSGFIEEVQNVRTSTRCALFNPKLVHVLPPSVELWKLRFYKESNISDLLSNIVTLRLLFSK